MKERIIELLETNHSYNEIITLLGCTKATISYHAKKLGISRAPTPKQYNWDEIQTFYNLGNSYRKCKEIYGFSSSAWDNAVKSSKLIVKNSKKDIASMKMRHTVKSNIIKNKIIPYVCKICGLGPEWNKEKLTLQLDHINGVNNDHRLENLRFLCPNCHSQTETFGNKKRKNIRE